MLVLVMAITAGMVEAQQRRQRLQAEEEAVNTAIIQETEEELQQINRSLYKVLTPFSFFLPLITCGFLTVPRRNILLTCVNV